LLQLPANDRREFVAITDVEFSPDGESVAIGASDGSVQVFRIVDRSRAHVVAHGDKSVSKIAFSPDGKLLASAAFLQVSLTVTGQGDERREINNVPLLKGSTCVTFSPDGKLIAVGNYRGNGAVIDLTKGESRFAIAPFAGTGPVDTGLYKPTTFAMDFSPDGTFLAVTTEFFDDELPSFRHVQVWDVKTGKLRFFFHGASCAFSPAGDLLAYRSEMYDGDGRIVLLDIDTFLPAAVLTGQFQDARFAPDGCSMAAMSRQQVEIWSIPCRDEQSRKTDRTMILRHTTNVTCLAFAPDGHSLVTGDAEGTLRLWNLPQ
jgi:WD40 repeat protein